ncbi:MAG: sigma-70 family RNA polymerase sigma factor [Polyangiaceae bacterium]
MIRLVHSQGPDRAGHTGGRHPDELAQLALAAGRGERSATHALLAALAPHLLRTVRSVLGRHDSDVEDIAQEAALVVLAALPGFRGEGSVVRFSTRTAVLVAMNARRKRAAAKRGGGSSLVDSDPAELAAHSDDPEQQLARLQAAAAVRSLLLSLPPAQAEALGLHCIGGCTLNEIATATGAPLQTVKSRLRLARQALRERLEGKPALLEILETDE